MWSKDNLTTSGHGPVKASSRESNHQLDKSQPENYLELKSHTLFPRRFQYRCIIGFQLIQTMTKIWYSKLILYIYHRFTVCCDFRLQKIGTIVMDFSNLKHLLIVDLYILPTFIQYTSQSAFTASECTFNSPHSGHRYVYTVDYISLILKHVLYLVLIFEFFCQALKLPKEEIRANP